MGAGPLVSKALRVVTGGNEQPRGGLGADTMVQSSTQRTLRRNVPIDSSSGAVASKVLNGGDSRHANEALWRIGMVRSVSDG